MTFSPGFMGEAVGRQGEKRSAWPIHTQQFPRESRSAADSRIDSSSKRHEITVGRAYDDPRMPWSLFVEFHKVPTIKRDQSAAVINRKLQHHAVRNGLPAKAAFLHGHHVVPQPP